MFSLFRLQENLRRLCKTQRRTGEAEIEKPIAWISIGADPEPTAVSRTHLHGKKKDADIPELFFVNGKGTNVFVTMEDELIDALFPDAPYARGVHAFQGR